MPGQQPKAQSIRAPHSPSQESTGLTVPKMQLDGIVRAYIDYEYLWISDLSQIINHLQRAYDPLCKPMRRDKAVRIPTGIRAGMQLFFYPPLQIRRIETRNSIEILCVGVAALLLELACITKRVFDARKAGWESEKAKWEAKEVELEVKQKLSWSSEEQKKAEREMQRLLGYVGKTETIKVFQLELGDYLIIEHRKLPPPDERA
jgi:hypothetical protein